jgi:glycosyltransferase involved in cell wall biosynthesis
MSTKPNVLLVTARAPWPTASGGQQRSFLLAEAIRRVATLHTLLISPRPRPLPADLDVMRQRFGLIDDGVLEVPRPSKWLHRMNPGRTEFFHSGPVADRVMRAATSLGCKVAVFRYLPLASKSARQPADGLCRLVDVDDVPSLRAQTEAGQAAGLRRLGKDWIAAGITRWQRRALEQVDGGWVSCQDDLDIIGDDRFSILPNIPLDAFDQAVDADRCRQDAGARAVLFVGAMDYDINRQAVDWFLEQVWPRVIRRQAQAVLRIAGSGLDAGRQRRYAEVDGVELLGFVDDLAGAYESSAMSVVPISAGAGTKIKVLESLRFGRPVVLTRHSLRGYEGVLEPGRDVMVADDPAAMADAIVQLLDAPDRRESMAQSGQALVAENFGFERFASVVADVVGPHLG